MIYLGSRYQQVTVEYLLDNRTGSTNPAVLRDLPYVVPSYTSMVWASGQRLDNMSDHLLNDQTSWWVIMDYNNEIIDPMSITPGMTVSTP